MARGKSKRKPPAGGAQGRLVRPPRPAGGDTREAAVLDVAEVAVGIDVHKMSMTVTAISGASEATARLETREFETFGGGLRACVGWLSGLRPGRVVMESTGVFWSCVLRALERAGVPCWLVNAWHVKHVPGRKSDLRDSEWLATLARYGLVRPSFVPDARLERLRQLTRTHTRMRDVATKLKGQLHRLLDEGGLRIGGILTDVLGASGRHMLEGLVRGDSVEALLEGVKGKARAKLDRLRDALQDGLDAQTRELLDMQYRLWSHVQGQVLEQEMRVLEAAKRDYRTAWRQLQTLPGCGPLAAAAVLAEIGPDMERFGSARRLASWAGVCPGNRESAGKRGSGRTRKGNRYLRRILCEIAHAASRTRNAQFGPLKKGLTVRRGTGRAVMAVAHKILRIIYAMLRDGAPYVDPEVDYTALVAKRNGPRWLRALADAGLLEEALRRHFERYGLSPPTAAA